MCRTFLLLLALAVVSCSSDGKGGSGRKQAEEQLEAERQRLRKEWDQLGKEREQLARERRAFRKAQEDARHKAGEDRARQEEATDQASREAREEVARRHREVERSIQLLPSKQEREVVGELWRRLKAGTFDLFKLTLLEEAHYRQHRGLLMGPELRAALLSAADRHPGCRKHIDALGLKGTRHEEAVKLAYMLLDPKVRLSIGFADDDFKKLGQDKALEKWRDLMRMYPDLFPTP